MLILLNYPKSFHVCNGKIPYKLAQNFAKRQKLNYYSPDVKPHRNRFARQNNAFIRMMIASSYVTRCTVITKVTSQTTKRNSNQNVHEYLTSPLPSRMPHIAMKCAVQTEQIRQCAFPQGRYLETGEDFVYCSKLTLQKHFDSVKCNVSVKYSSF